MISSLGLIARIALPAAVAATGQFCEVKVVGHPLTVVSPVQQEPLVELVPIRCGSLRRSMPMTVAVPLESESAGAVTCRQGLPVRNPVGLGISAGVPESTRLVGLASLGAMVVENNTQTNRPRVTDDRIQILKCGLPHQGLVDSDAVGVLREVG